MTTFLHTDRSPRLKRRLLREAVDENLSELAGESPARRTAPAAAPEPRPSASRLARLARLALLALVPLAALAAVHLLRRAPEAQADAAASSTTPAAPVEAVAPEDPASQLTFPAPRPIDARAIPLEVRRVTIDPGHGGDDHGTIENGLSEKELTLDIARRLRDFLERDSFKVHLTREDDRTLSLRDRAEFANRVGSDVFISIHINWLFTRQVRGIETYFLGPTEDPEVTELARRENQRSGYTLAEMRPILDEIYTDYLHSQSRRFAGRIQRSLFTSLKRVNPKLRNRGTKTAPFVVLVSTEMPAILAEVACLSNDEEAELLARPLYRAHIAEALARGIRGYADDVNQTEEKGI